MVGEKRFLVQSARALRRLLLSREGDIKAPIPSLLFVLPKAALMTELTKFTYNNRNFNYLVLIDVLYIDSKLVF